MYIYTFFLLKMTDTMTSQNIDLSSWDTLYIIQLHQIQNPISSMENKLGQ
jgi:hypothetical protein